MSVVPVKNPGFSAAATKRDQMVVQARSMPLSRAPMRQLAEVRRSAFSKHVHKQAECLYSSAMLYETSYLTTWTKV